MKRIAVSVLALALTAVAGGAGAAYQDYGNGSRYDSNDSRNSATRPDVATVIRAEPRYDRYSSNNTYQREECWDEQSNAYQSGYYRDENGRLYRSGHDNNTTGGTLIGALIGGALGNQVGKGDGRKAATIGGAVIGGAIGHEVAENHDSYDEYRDNSGIVRRCRMVTESSGPQGMSGYDVTYRYAGQIYHAVTRYRPGRTIRVVVNVRPQDEVAYSH
jgi:uncharacterized protein YcfJ